MAIADGVEEVCVIGGSLLYAETLPLADRLRLSELKLDVEGDTHFPPLDKNWIEVSREEVPQGCQ